MYVWVHWKKHVKYSRISNKLIDKIHVIGFDLPSKNKQFNWCSELVFFHSRFVLASHCPPTTCTAWLNIICPISIALRLQSHGMEDAAKWDEENLYEANIHIFTLQRVSQYSLMFIARSWTQSITSFRRLAGSAALMAYSRAALVVKQLFHAQIMQSNSSLPKTGCSSWLIWKATKLNLLCCPHRLAAQKSWESSWIISVLQPSSSAYLGSLVIVSRCCKSLICNYFHRFPTDSHMADLRQLTAAVKRTPRLSRGGAFVGRRVLAA